MKVSNEKCVLEEIDDVKNCEVRLGLGFLYVIVYLG